MGEIPIADTPDVDEVEMVGFPGPVFFQVVDFKGYVGSGPVVTRQIVSTMHLPRLGSGQNAQDRWSDGKNSPSRLYRAQIHARNFRLWMAIAEVESPDTSTGSAIQHILRIFDRRHVELST